MVYAAGTDPGCYPGTQVLRNKANLTLQEELDQFELAMTLIRADEPWPDGRLDYGHYLALHHHLFQDVYDWAGQIRTIRIGKAGNWFCYPDYIDREMQHLFEWLLAQGHFLLSDIDSFRTGAAHLLAELNAIHPFRDGNGRTQMAFLALWAERAGYGFREAELEPAMVMQAMIASFSGKGEPLRGLLGKLIVS